MSFNVILNGYPVASANTFEEAFQRVGSNQAGEWKIEDGYGRPVWTEANRKGTARDVVGRQ